MRAITRAVEGFDRRAFTVSEVLHRQEAGIFSQEESRGPHRESRRVERGADEALTHLAPPAFSIHLSNY